MLLRRKIAHGIFIIFFSNKDSVSSIQIHEMSLQTFTEAMSRVDVSRK